MALLIALFIVAWWLGYWLERLETEASFFGTLRYDYVFLLLALVKVSYLITLSALVVVVVSQVMLWVK